MAGIYFSTDKAVDRVHASVDRPGALGPPWIPGGADRGWGRGTVARSGAPKLAGGGAKRRGRHREID